jgi:hypothetical protein
MVLLPGVSRREVKVSKQADLGAVVEGLDAHVEHDAGDRGVGERRRASVALGSASLASPSDPTPAAKSAYTWSRRARADAAVPG